MLVKGNPAMDIRRQIASIIPTPATHIPPPLRSSGKSVAQFTKIQNSLILKKDKAVLLE
jgi:hypothetical protein